MPTDTGALLRQLTIDRPPPSPGGGRAVRRTAAGLLLAGSAGGLLWLWLGGLPATSQEAGATSAGPQEAAAPNVVPQAVQSPGATSDPGPSANRVLLNGTGYVVARRQATVSSKTTSRVAEVLIEEGMRVEAGQVLARLDDNTERAELALAAAQQAAAEAALAELEALLTHARQELARTRALAQHNLASESLLDQRTTEVGTLHARIERAHREVAVASRRVQLHETRLTDLIIRAPFAGVVIEKSVQPGEMISPVSAGGGFTRTGIGTVVDMSSLEVEVDVTESYINRVSVDQPVEIVLNAYPDRTYQGRVLAVIPTADRSKATIRVRIGFEHIDGHVLPEMGIKAAFLQPAVTS